jgi:hypothetical protein
VTLPGEAASKFVRQQRTRVFVYEVGPGIPVFIVLIFVIPGVLAIVLFFLTIALFVVLGELWFAGVMRRAATMTWSDVAPAMPMARLQDLGLVLYPNQPSGYHEPSLGRPFVWSGDDGLVVCLERDVLIGHAVVLAEVAFVTFFDPGRAVLMTYGDARPMMLQPRRFFLQSTGPPTDVPRALELHRAAAGRLVLAGMRPRVVESAIAAKGLIAEFAVRLPSLGGAAGITAKRADEKRSAQLRLPLWEQRDYRRRLVHCLANAPAR